MFWKRKYSMSQRKYVTGPYSLQTHWCPSRCLLSDLNHTRGISPQSRVKATCRLRDQLIRWPSSRQGSKICRKVDCLSLIEGTALNAGGGAPGAKALQNPLLGLGTGIKPVFEIRVRHLSFTIWKRKTLDTDTSPGVFPQQQKSYLKLEVQALRPSLGLQN